MEAFVKRQKRKSSPTLDDGNADEPTDVKLAMLSSLHPEVEQEVLLDILLAHDGSVQEAAASLQHQKPAKRSSGALGSQASLRHFLPAPSSAGGPPSPKKPRLLSRKGRTLFLYDPADIAEHTPCTVVHNFLPAALADDLLRELLEESKTYEPITFKLFDQVVSSPHTSSLYLADDAASARHRRDYVYNGASLTDVRALTPAMALARPLVRDAVNAEVAARVAARYPGGRRLRFQSSRDWAPNAAFVNCYDGPRQSVGWHSDQLTYLGPRAVIGSLSLGVAREFRVRRVVPRDGDDDKPDGDGDDEDKKTGAGTDSADEAGQISIRLPHNSLLVMHAEMQEEWKHSVAPARAVDPHPVAGNRRINVTYRDYRAEFHPRFTPRCPCGVPTVLRVVQRRRANRGRYFWMCHAGNVPGKEGCTFFRWAEFDDEGNPVWDTGGKAEAGDAGDGPEAGKPGAAEQER